MGIKKVSNAIEVVTNTISEILPSVLNIGLKIEGGQFDTKTQIFSFDEATVDFNLGNKK